MLTGLFTTRGTHAVLNCAVYTRPIVIVNTKWWRLVFDSVVCLLPKKGLT